MAAITIRNLPDHVHEWLKDSAKAWDMSAEALCRLILGEAISREGKAHLVPPVTGVAEVRASYTGPVTIDAPALSPELWGALKGSVHVPPETDLTAPLAEAWHAEA
jgi:plasmid stability protein